MASVSEDMNKYCKEQLCTLCPCGKYEFPECVDRLKELREEKEKLYRTSNADLEELRNIIRKSFEDNENQKPNSEDLALDILNAGFCRIPEKAEIGRLTEENRTLDNEWDNTTKYCNELQKQVDELKEERENMQAVIFGLEEDKRQLEKQVDELKDICLDCPYKLRFDKIEKQAVKNTAKAVITDMFKEIQGYENIDVILKRIAERYGVEVNDEKDYEILA